MGLNICRLSFVVLLKKQTSNQSEESDFQKNQEQQTDVLSP